MKAAAQLEYQEQKLKQPEKHQNQPSCSLYMAPTSTTIPSGQDENFLKAQKESGEDPGPLKMSIYAGVDLKPGTLIGIPEIAIPIIDIHIHNQFRFGNKDGAEGVDPETYFEAQQSFFWDANTAHAHLDIYENKHGNSHRNNDDADDDYDDEEEVQVESNLILAVPGVGALGNQHFTSYINAKVDPEAVLNRIPIQEQTRAQALLNSDSISVPPTRGANSKYYDVTMKSTRYIPAGMEILVDDVGGGIDEEYPIQASDFDDVDAIWQKIWDFFVNHDNDIDHDNDLVDEKKEQLYNYLIKDVVSNQYTKTLKGDDRGNKEDVMEQIRALFPSSYAEFATMMSSSSSSFSYEFPHMVKSQEWLMENGQCLDGIRTGPSTIPHAEKGAFASKYIHKGGLIGPAPLLMIPDRDYLDMFELTFMGEGRDRYIVQKKLQSKRSKGTGGRMESSFVEREATTQQLLLNYCFGHPESSLLFYPYGMGINMINHQSSSAEEMKGANAKLVWTKALYHDSNLLEQEVMDEEYAALPLGMDIIATRDISEGEEIFLDYGSDWEEAWEQHVDQWDDSRLWPVSALEFNADFRSKRLPFPTDAERGGSNKDAIPEHLITACHVVANPLDKFDGDGVQLWIFDKNQTTLNADHYRLCNILDLETTTIGNDTENGDTSSIPNTYTVTVHGLGDESGPQIVTNVPHEFIRFTEKPYSEWGYQTNNNVFRHTIGIPDDIFPSVWRDLA